MHEFCERRTLKKSSIYSIIFFSNKTSNETYWSSSHKQQINKMRKSNSSFLGSHTFSFAEIQMLTNPRLLYKKCNASLPVEISHRMNTMLSQSWMLTLPKIQLLCLIICYMLVYVKHYLCYVLMWKLSSWYLLWVCVLKKELKS